MRSHEHGDVVERDGVVARVLPGADGVDDAVALLDAAEAAAGIPLVDESERERLRALAAGERDRAASWHSVLARRDERAVGYAGIVVPPDERRPLDEQTATGDVALAPWSRDGRPGSCPVLSALLASLASVATRHEAGRLEVWLRHADAAELACAADAGFGVERRLGVLGRVLDEEVPPVDPPAGVTIRPYAGEADDTGVVDVLAGAYAGTAEGGWTLDRFRERRGYAWFEPDDLLLAERDDATLAGLHWLKRRGGGVGEVYNLAIHPDAQGTGLGRVLLRAGLAHLRAVGCDDVVLWVDRANEPAVRLYVTEGFTTQWEDVALVRTTARR